MASFITQNMPFGQCEEYHRLLGAILAKILALYKLGTWVARKCRTANTQVLPFNCDMRPFPRNENDAHPMPKF